MKKIINVILACLGIGTGVAAVVLGVIEKINLKDASVLLGIGLSCLSILSLQNLEKKQ